MDNKHPYLAKTSNATKVSGTQTHASSESKQDTETIADTIDKRLPPLAQSRRSRTLQNFFLVWLDENMDKRTEYFRQNLAYLKNIVYTILPFSNTQECLANMNSIKNEKFLLMTSESVGKEILPQVHDIAWLVAIFIVSKNASQQNTWALNWQKVKCVSTKIEHIGKSLKEVIQQYEHNSTPMSFVPIKRAQEDDNLNKLQPSFMYTMLFKEILLETKQDDKKSMERFITYCHKENIPEKQLYEFQKQYYEEKPIWIYTTETFLYSFINKCLRDLDMTTMIRVGFFIRNLHQQLEEVNKQQASEFDDKFIVYRGQGMAKHDFENLMSIKGGLLGFNSFLSTSRTPSVSLSFLEQNSGKDGDNAAILFILAIDKAKAAALKTPFAKVDKYSAHPDENEILFSMHTIFRVGDIKQVVNRITYWEVQLTITDDSDPQLKELIRYMQNEISGSGWYRMENLMDRVGIIDKAEELKHQLLIDATNEMEQAYAYHQLGRLKYEQAKYVESIEFYTKSIQIRQEMMMSEDLSLADTYNNMALAYFSMPNYSEALKYYQKSQNIYEKILPPINLSLATSYYNLGKIYKYMGNLSVAFEYYDKANIILKKILPPTHPDMAIFHSNEGEKYLNMSAHFKAIECFEKALKIQENSLPPFHFDIATSHYHIGEVYKLQGDYIKAIHHYIKAVKIREKTPPSIHPDMAKYYNSIGQTYNYIQKYPEALEYFQKSYNILEKLLPSDHVYLIELRNSIGVVYGNMGEYSKALDHFEEELKLIERTAPFQHLLFLNSLVKIGQVYINMGNYSTALKCYRIPEKVLQNSLGGTHPDMGKYYSYIGEICNKIGKYPEALEYFQKSYKILEKLLPSDHPYLIMLYYSLGGVYGKMGEYSKAFEQFKETLKRSEVSAENHDLLINIYSSIGELHSYIGEYSKALDYYEQMHRILEKHCSATDPRLAFSYGYIGKEYHSMSKFSMAYECYRKAIKVQEKIPTPNDQNLADFLIGMSIVYRSLGEFSKALEYFRKARVILNRVASPIHHTLVSLYTSVAMLYNDIGNYENALRAMHQAFEIQLPILKEGNIWFGYGYLMLGHVRKSMKDYPKALSCYEKGLSILRDVLPLGHPYVCLGYDSVGNIHRLMGNFQKALEFHREALAIENNRTYYPSESAKIYISFGELYHELKDYSTAMMYLKKGLKIRQEIFPKDHPYLAIAFHNIAKLCLSTGRYHLAMKFCQKAVEIGQLKLHRTHPNLIDYKETESAIRKYL